MVSKKPRLLGLAALAFGAIVVLPSAGMAQDPMEGTVTVGMVGNP